VFESFQGGRYKVTKKLGEGGKGIVLKAEDTRLGRTVAIKVIKGEGLDQESLPALNRKPRPPPASLIPTLLPYTTSAKRVRAITSSWSLSMALT